MWANEQALDVLDFYTLTFALFFLNILDAFVLEVSDCQSVIFVVLVDFFVNNAGDLRQIKLWQLTLYSTCLVLILFLILALFRYLNRQLWFLPHIAPLLVQNMESFILHIMLLINYLLFIPREYLIVLLLLTLIIFCQLGCTKFCKAESTS